MSDTRENILLAALRLFAENGYEAVSVSQIAGELGITKGALYRHYQNKRDIFDSIVARMEKNDEQRAKEFALPEGTLAEMEEKYRGASMSQMIEYAKAQFRYWTEDHFASSFRRMLTLEQYRNEKMKLLYQNYLAAGPLGYLEDLFSSLGYEHAQMRAVSLYAPMHLFFSVYDGAQDKKAVLGIIDEHLESIRRELTGEEHEDT